MHLHACTRWNLNESRESFHSVMVNVLDCDTVINEFEPQSCCYVQFQVNVIKKAMNPLIHIAMGLNGNTTVLLQGRIWH